MADEASIPPVRSFNRISDRSGLPLVESNVGFDGLGSKPGFRAVGSLGEFIEPR